jgi:hypothetical protein
VSSVLSIRGKLGAAARRGDARQVAILTRELAEAKADALVERAVDILEDAGLPADPAAIRAKAAAHVSERMAANAAGIIPTDQNRGVLAGVFATDLAGERVSRET